MRKQGERGTELGRRRKARLASEEVSMDAEERPKYLERNQKPHPRPFDLATSREGSGVMIFLQ